MEVEQQAVHEQGREEQKSPETKLPHAAAAAAAGDGEAEADAVSVLPRGWPSFLNTQESYAVPDTRVASDRLTARYVGRGNHPLDVGTVRANFPAPRGVAVYYFEVAIQDAGLKGKVTVGLTPAKFTLTRAIGTRSGSYGYRGEDARKLDGSPGSRPSPYGSTFTTGDVIGCGINFPTGEIFFTKNGQSLGVAFKDVSGIFYPSASMHSAGEEVMFNFGATQFRFDIEGYRREESMKLRAKVTSTPLDSSILNPLIADYLAHAGYLETCQAFRSLYGITETKRDEEIDTAARKRKQIRDLILAGRIDEAMDALATLCPSLVTETPARSSGRPSLRPSPSSLSSSYANGESNGSPSHGSGASMDPSALLLLRLRMQKFIEMIREDKVDEAVVFAREVLSQYRGEDGAQQYLREGLGLLAYPHPQDSPVGYLLQQSQREQLADLVNAAILEHLQQPKWSTLEKLLRQLLVSEEALLEARHGMGEPFSLT